jgi:hypothetical protein
VVQRTGEFSLAFVVAAAVVLTGAASYSFIVGRVEPIEFGSAG